jgi:uncharacterized OB-fold protein
MSETYLPAGLPAPAPAIDGLDVPYWEANRQGKLLVQQCGACGTWQWGPEWLCHKCRTFDMKWVEVATNGLIHSWERPWHPVHPALKDHGPYIVVIVELPHCNNVRMIGNLLGDPLQDVIIGAPVEAVFEHHNDAEPPYSLVQWQTV